MQKYRSLREYTLDDVRSTFPHVQERIFEALVNLSPEQFGFELQQVSDKRTFCMTAVDHETWEIIGHVMSEVLEQQDLIMTRDDVVLCYTRFKELMYLKSAVDQGLLEPKITDSGLEYYYTVGDQSNTHPEQIDDKPYLGRSIRRYKNIG
jgi:hypothetical protein